MEIVIGLVIGLIVGAVVTGLILWTQIKPNLDARESAFDEKMVQAENRIAQIETELRRRREAIEEEARTVVRTAQEEAKGVRLEVEKNAERRYRDISRVEERLDLRQSSQDRLQKKLELRESALKKRASNLDRRESKLANLELERQNALQSIAEMTRDEAVQQLLEAVEKEARQDMARVMRQIEDEARETAEEKARHLIAQAIQRVASEHVSEIVVSTVPLPSDDMKGRIIGRSGRNIQAFELAAGVDLIVDDTPESVTVSCFDGVRREIARRALEKLITDGRIHPARIEKLIADATKDVNRLIKEAGEKAAYEANVHGLHGDVLRVLGRLKYRTSYGQNQLDHAVEAAKIAGILAAEMGADVSIAKMGGLLHDIGKAMDHDQEGTHALIGAEFLRRFKVPKNVVNAVASHHHEVEQDSVEAVIVEAADAISGARPGARRESLENYIKRVRTLEDVANSFDGVQSAYALQAGREVRILVRPESVDDLGAMRLSKDIARTIEDSMQYPGQIQVTVIREKRAVGFAK